MIEYYLRPTYQKILVDPCVLFIAKFASANTITYLACLSGIMIAPLLIHGYSVLASFMLLASGYLDTLDGTLARYTKSTSQKGTMLDIICDRIVELSVIIGLFGINPSQRGWHSLLMLGSILICITTFLVVGIFQENSTNKGFYYSRGFIERAEAFIFFLAMILFPQYFDQLAFLFSILVLITSIHHFYRFNH